jgi:two-component system chemotaxis response regulator CheB
LPIVAVLHLPDERRSQLAEVLPGACASRCWKADKEAIEPGTLYFAGPGYHLSVEQDRSLSLSQEDRVHYSRPAIDYLFASAADAYGRGPAAVLLTGANEDGARPGAGQASGGTTVVQDPDEGAGRDATGRPGPAPARPYSYLSRIGRCWLPWNKSHAK